MSSGWFAPQLNLQTFLSQGQNSASLAQAKNADLSQNVVFVSKMQILGK